MPKTNKKLADQNPPLLYGLLGLAAGLFIAGTFGVFLAQSHHDEIMDHLKDSRRHKSSINHMDMSMNEMTAGLKDKKGDAYDKAFLQMMVAHHQGAIDMAELSEDRAKHDEIKHLSQDIISAQAEEINDMEQWLSDWGYQTKDKQGMDH